MSAGPDVVVVGAGIVGASVAYHAARAGARVTLLEAGQPGAGVTAGSFAWVGASGVRTGPAAELRRTATEEYRRLGAELPGLPVTWSGSLTWRRGDGVPEAGPGQQLVDPATILRLEPRLRRAPMWALWAADDGAVDPVGVTRRLVAGARTHGAVTLPDASVTTLRRDAEGRVTGVETAAGSLSGASVVLAAGVATAALAASVGISVPVEPSPATLVGLRAPADLVRTVVTTEDFDLRQVGPDRLVAAADDPDRALAAVRSTFRGADNVQLLDVRRSPRPMPADGEPIIGPVAGAPGLYVAVMHAAVTLGPAVGRLVARELVDGVVEPLLDGCRPDRF